MLKICLKFNYGKSNGLITSLKSDIIELTAKVEGRLFDQGIDNGRTWLYYYVIDSINPYDARPDNSVIKWETSHADNKGKHIACITSTIFNGKKLGLA